jgi:hypothetical protein
MKNLKLKSIGKALIMIFEIVLMCLLISSEQGLYKACGGAIGILSVFTNYTNEILIEELRSKIKKQEKEDEEV